MLAVIADHGMVAMDPTTVVDLDAAPALMAGVRAVGGEVRARYLYTQPGAAPDVLATWRAELGDRAWVMSRAEAIDAGWVGPKVADWVLPRIGDVVVAARDRFGVLRRRHEAGASALTGHHGSLTTAEQLVPLAIAVG